jgi:hypothetical protein
MAANIMSKSQCPEINALTHPLDRQGTLYVDGVKHSTGLFYTNSNSGLYVSSLQYSLNIPQSSCIVLNSDEGQNIEIDQIYPCPSGGAHHHFKIEL